MTDKINSIDVNDWELKGVLIPIMECKYFEGIGDCKESKGLCIANENCYFKQLKRLQEENEGLKANKGRCAFKSLDNTFCDEAKFKIDKLELDKDCLNASLETARKYRGIAEADRDKYKQALEEIRNYCDEQNLKADYTACYITNRIDEVLNDRN